MRTSGFGESACTPTSGVSPISPSTSSYFMVASGSFRPAGDGRQDREHVAVVHLGVETVEVADVVVVLVDVHELVQAAAVVQQVAAQTGIPLDERLEHFAHGRALDRDGRLAVGVGAQHGGELDL